MKDSGDSGESAPLCRFEIVSELHVRFYDFHVTSEFHILRDAQHLIVCVDSSPLWQRIEEFTLYVENSVNTNTTLRYMEKECHFNGPCIQWPVALYGQGSVIELDQTLEMRIRRPRNGREFVFNVNPRN